MILIESSIQSPSPFVNLPNCIAGFPSLKHLDFFFGGREKDPPTWMNRLFKDRMQTPSHFNDALIAIGVPAEVMAIGILDNPDTKWSVYESLLRSRVYSMLRIWATMKHRQEPKKVDG